MFNSHKMFEQVQGQLAKVNNIEDLFYGFDLLYI
jgi:hypothetical protein